MVPYNLPFLLSPPLNALVSGALFYKKWILAADTVHRANDRLRLHPASIRLWKSPK